MNNLGRSRASSLARAKSPNRAADHCMGTLRPGAATPALEGSWGGSFLPSIPGSILVSAQEGWICGEESRLGRTSGPEKNILTSPTRHGLAARLECDVNLGGACNGLTLEYSSHVKVNLISSRIPGLDVLLAVLCVRHSHNSGYVHALHSIRGQRTLYHTGICIPTNLYPAMARHVPRLFVSLR
jgi:hypothetical protein